MPCLEALPWAALGRGWERKKRKGEGWQRLVGTEGAVQARTAVVASMVRTGGEGLGTLTAALALPLPVSCGAANSPEELRWRQ